MKTLIKNARILTMDESYQIFHPGYLEIEGDHITALGAQEAATGEIKAAIVDSQNYEGKVIDAEDGILIPGMINAHTHVGMVPFRSLGDDMKDRLRRFLFPLEADMTEELVRASARYAMAEMLLSGITCFGDMYYYEEAIMEETLEMGMRALVGETVLNLPTCDGNENPYFGLTYSRNWIPRAQHHSLVKPMIAPHATNTNSRQALQEVQRIAQEYQVPIMMHVSEMDYELDYFSKEYGLTPIEFLAQEGLLTEHLIAVHCIHLTDHDIELLANHNGKVVHCIGANMKSAKGVAPIKKLLEAGVAVGIGTDGPSSGNTLELFTIMRTMAYAHKTANQDRSLFTSRELLELATVGGAKVLGLEKVGRLKVGYQADLTLIETDSVNMFPIFDPYSVLVYSANASNVRSVWIAGNLLVKDKQLQRDSLGGIRARLNHQMGAFSARAAELAQ